MKLDVYENGQAWAQSIIEAFGALAESCLEARGQFTCALTGGSTVRRVYPRLAELDLDWPRIHFFWGDERAVPPEHDDSNFGAAWRAALSQIDGLPEENLHRMRGDAEHLETAALDYQREIRHVVGDGQGLDLVHLGMGADGHVASLFPDHLLLTVRDRWVAHINDSPKPPPDRLTLTLPALAAAGHVWFLVSGQAKAPAVAEAVREAHSSLPAALVARSGAEVRWFLDEEAAAQLESEWRGGARSGV